MPHTDPTNPTQDDSPRPLTREDFRGRDAMALHVFGVFFTLLGLFVLMGIFFGEAPTVARAINVAAAAVLMLVGGAMWVLGRRLTRGEDSP